MNPDGMVALLNYRVGLAFIRLIQLELIAVYSPGRWCHS